MTDVVGGVVSSFAPTRFGEQHGQLMLEACFLACDRLEGVKNSPHEARFMEQLVASVGQDRMLESPAGMGYNGDRSDRRWVNGGRDNWHYMNENLTSYNGEVPS